MATPVISVDDTKNWQIFRATLNAALAMFGLLADPNTWAGKQTFAGGAAIKGTTTNDNAAAGYVGEYISAEVLVGSAVSLTSGANANLTSISLTAGDWDVSATAGYVFTIAATIVRGGISIVSATFPTSGPGYMAEGIASGSGLGQQSFAITTTRMSLAATTTVYLVVNSSFTGTATGYGFIGARRMR